MGADHSFKNIPNPNANKVFPFASNLSAVLQFLHSLKSILKQDDIEKDLIESCIKPLISHQIHHQKSFGFVGLDLLLNIDNKSIIKSLFNLLYAPNNNDKKLNELIEKSNKQCLRIESQINNQSNNEYDNKFEEIPMDTFCYLLSFVSPRNLRSIQCISYSFYSAIQRPATNVMLSGYMFYRITRTLDADKALNADIIGLHHKDITFFKMYSCIKQLSVSYCSLNRLIKLFNYPNYHTFWDQFHNLKQLNLDQIENEQNCSLNNLIECLINTKYLKYTLEDLTLCQLSSFHDAQMIISVQTLKYLQQFINLNSLYIDGYIILHDDLQNFEYINEHYLEIQSFIKHINDISIGCAPFNESITSSFFSLFFHPNIKSLFFRLGTDPVFDQYGQYVVLNNFMNQLKDNKHKLLGLNNLNNLEQFNIFTDPELIINATKSHLWISLMIENMRNLHTFTVSQWNTLLIFGNDIDIFDININHNILRQLISNNINTLENIHFCNKSYYSRTDVLNKNSWIPLFLIHNILIYGINFKHFEDWMKNKFKYFEFYMEINQVPSKNIFVTKFDNLKLNFFPKVQSIIRSLKELFGKYDIKYSIKLEFYILRDDMNMFCNKNIMGEYVLQSFSDQFKTAKIIDQQLIFEDDNQTLITDYFPVL